MKSPCKQMRRAAVTAVLAFAMTLCVPVFAHAASQNSGTFASNTHATWTLDSAGNLCIDGTGKIDADDGLYNICNSIKTVTIGKNITGIGFETFCYFTNLKSVTFDKDSKLSSIEGYAFNNCQSLSSITIPASVKSIGNSAFAGCFKLSNATVAKGSVLKTIGTSAFSNCTSLKKAVTSESLKTVGSYAFNGCQSIASITIPKTVTSVGAGAFNNCSNLKKISVLSPEKTKIASSAFNGTKKKGAVKTKKIKITSIRKAGKGKLKITWTKVSNAKSYVVYYKRTGASKYKHVTVKGAKKKTATLRKLKKGKKYTVYVKAKSKTKTLCKSKKKKSPKVK